MVVLTLGLKFGLVIGMIWFTGNIMFDFFQGEYRKGKNLGQDVLGVVLGWICLALIFWVTQGISL